MIILEIVGKTLKTPKDRQLIHVNGQPLDITAKGSKVYVNGKRVNGSKLPVPEILGVVIALSLWYTIHFTEYGMQFIEWALR